MTPRTLNNGYRGNNGNFHNMIFLSLIIHLVVITIILISVPTTSRHLTFGTTYSVQLVGSEIITPAHDYSGLKDILQTNEAPSSIIIRRKIISIAPIPVKNQEMKKFNIEKAVSAIRQNQQDKPKTSAAASVAGPAKMSESEVNAQTKEYVGVVWSRVKKNWTMPQVLLPKENIETIIDVKISRSGALEYVGFKKRSGNRYFDDTALRAIRKSNPFPPLPNFMDNEFSIRFPSEKFY
jgi:TonB family protein